MLLTQTPSSSRKPMQKFNPSSPFSVIQSLVVHRDLVFQFTRREVAGRYKGSVLGVFWSLVNPLLLLGVYTFVFGVVFKSRWRPTSTDHFEFAVVMFVGLISHSLLAECINRAPNLIVNNTNLVKRVIFPLRALAWVTVGTALFHLAVASIILVCAVVLWQHTIPVTALLAPVILIPYMLAIVGAVWALMSLGVYLRDIGQLTGLLASILMFLAPVFYPISSVPARFQPFIYLNPLTFIIEQLRDVIVWGRGPNWIGLLIYLVVGYLIAWIGLWCFERTRSGFADVL
jgi:lipopolysaccharide transport system permease protein